MGRTKLRDTGPAFIAMKGDFTRIAERLEDFNMRLDLIVGALLGADVEPPKEVPTVPDSFVEGCQQLLKRADTSLDRCDHRIKMLEEETLIKEVK